MKTLRGSIVALVTPMHQDGTIDYKAFQQLIAWHLQSQTAGLVIAGTTGEAATLTTEERNQLIKVAVEQVAGRIPVIAGTGTPSTKTTIENTQAAEASGADACLVVTPYYNKPTQKGLLQHYKAIAESVTFPVLIYNVPGRTACDILPETVGQLSKIANIIGIKEAVNKRERAQNIKKHCHKNFIILSGDDETAADWMLHELAQGVISVTANIAPKTMQLLCEACFIGDAVTAQYMQQILLLLHQRLFVTSNPIPVKWA